MTYESLIQQEWATYLETREKTRRHNDSVRKRMAIYEEENRLYQKSFKLFKEGKLRPEPEPPTRPPPLKDSPRMQRHTMESTCTLSSCKAPIVWYHYTTSSNRTIPQHRFRLCAPCAAKHWNKHHWWYEQQRGRA